MKPVIMVVDDDQLFLEEVGEVLRSGGYETVEVYDPCAAVATAQRFRPSVILLDLKMPGRNGFEIAFELKDIPALADIPVIAMSGLSNQKTSVYLGMSGIRKCLTKPFNPLDLIWTIEDILIQEQMALA